MVNSIKEKTLLGYPDFFSEKIKDNKFDLANKIGITKLKLFCFHILSLYRSNSNYSIEEFLNRMFTTDTFIYINSPSYHYLKNTLDEIKRKNPNNNFEIISVESILNMYIWVIKNEQNLANKEEIESSKTITFFKLYLLFNDDIIKKIKDPNKLKKSTVDISQLYKYQLAISFSQNDLINFDYALLIITQLYKAAKLLIFMRENDKYKTILSIFLTKYHFKKTVSYVSIMKSLIMLIMQDKENSNSIIIDDGPNKIYQKLIVESFLCKESIITDEQNDFKEIRNSPLEKINNYEYFIIFDLFIVKKIYNGLLFTLNGIDSELKLLENKKPTFFGEIRKDFSEGVLVYQIMNKVLSDNKYEKINGDDLTDKNLKKLDREPDYLAINSNEVLLFESKDFYMDGKDKLSYDFDTIVKGLTIDKKGKLDRIGKAVVQIAKNIERIFLEEFELKSNYDPNSIKIYPIVIVHDALYSCPSLNYWVNSWLIDEKEKLKNDERFNEFNFKNIKPLTIIEIDTMIIYRTNFENGEVNLVDLIDKFQSYVNYENENNDILQSSIPFAKFVDDYAIASKIKIDIKSIKKEILAIN